MRQLLMMLIMGASLVAETSMMDTLLSGDNACMVVFDQKEENFIILNEARAAVQFTPFSTHKIPHSLIALETGIVQNVDTPLSWDSERYPKEDWWPKTWAGEHNLRSAIKVSLVPAYRQIALEAGVQTMQRYISQFRFGNEDISSGVDSYWLNGSLEISAMGQVNFLRRFFAGELGLQEKTTSAVRDILVQEQTEKYVLSFKTGTGTIDTETGKALAWLVGYVERNDNVYFFAFNMEASNFSEAVNLRMKTARSILTQLGLIEA